MADKKFLTLKKSEIMGKKSTKSLRRKAQEIYNLYPDRFTTDFEHNKKSLDELEIFTGKLSRNLVAGLLVTLATEKVL